MKYRRGHWGMRETGAEGDVRGLYDLIIGSDLLYDREQPEALSQFIDRHSAGSVEVLIADPDRGNQARFKRKMGVLGYSHSEVRISSLPGDGGPYKGRLHTLRRAAFA
jgi:hypothetical protein